MPDVQVKDVLSLQVLGGKGGLHKAQGRNSESRTFQQICGVVGIPKIVPCDHSLKGWCDFFFFFFPPDSSSQVACSSELPEVVTPSIFQSFGRPQDKQSSSLQF